MAMHRDGSRAYIAKIALAASAVESGVSIQHFFPITTRRHADPVVLPGLGREIAHKRDLFVWIATSPPETDDTPLAVVAVDPIKAAGFGIALVQSRLAAVKRIQVAHPTLQPAVQ